MSFKIFLRIQTLESSFLENRNLLIFLDIRVDWQIFNETDNDSQLLDFILAYNEDFPHLDEQGNELLPEEDGKLSFWSDWEMFMYFTFHSLSVCLSVCLSVYLCVCLSVCLSVYIIVDVCQVQTDCSIKPDS
jgi:hypothetical protein